MTDCSAVFSECDSYTVSGNFGQFSANEAIRISSGDRLELLGLLKKI